MSSSGFRAGYSEARRDALTPNTEGIFWLTPHQSSSYYIVIPSVQQVESAHRLFVFERAFDCATTTEGELWVVKPAIAQYDQGTGEFFLKQRGALEVRAAEPALATASLPPAFETTSLVTETIREPQSPLDRTAPPPKPAVEAVGNKGLNKSVAIAAGGSLVILAIILAVVVSWQNSPKNRILSSIKQGNLFTPPGTSAYDLYQQSVLSDGDKSEIRATVGPVLEGNGNSFISKVARESHEPSNDESQEMIRTYSWLDSLDPKNSYKARKRYFQGWQYYQNKDYKNAGNEFTQATTLDPSWAMPVNKMAHVAMRNRDYYSALRYYEKAIQLDSKWIIPLLNLGMLVIENQYGIKDYYAAENAARRALDIDPRKASAYYILGRALESQQRGCEALKAYRKAIEYGSNVTSPGFNVTTLSRAADKLASRLNCSGD
jgi:hypothetical protein